MREERVLGAYCGLGGGRIYLDLMGSLETGTAESTLYHEQCHGWLGRTTELGFLQAALEMEAWLAEDEPYHRALLRWVQFLTEKTRTVQEVFATNMELLKVWEYHGREEMLRLFQGLPEVYQMYYRTMSPVHVRGGDLPTQRQQISALCAWAMNAVLSPGEVKSLEGLEKALSGPNDPTDRLKAALDRFRQTGETPEVLLEEDRLLELAQEVAPRAERYLREGFHQLPQVLADLERRLERGEEQAVGEEMTRSLLRRASLFEPGRLGASHTAPVEPKGRGALLWRVADGEERWSYGRLLTWQGGYREETVSAGRLAERLEGCDAPILLYADQRACPDLLAAWKGVRTVLFQTQEECESWLMAEGHRSVYVGEGRAVAGQTDLRLLFFCLREAPETLWLFPTVSYIRDRLLERTGLTGRCVPAHRPGFLRLFGAFPDEGQILRHLQACLTLLLGRSWTEFLEDPKLCPLAASLGRTLGNSALRIKQKDYFRRLAALPLPETGGAPFFCLMRFDDEGNTGDTYLEGNSRAALLFPERETAERFARRYETGYTAVGVDRRYWPYFYEMVNSAGGMVVLALDPAGTRGEYVSVDRVAEHFGLPRRMKR